MSHLLLQIENRSADICFCIDVRFTTADETATPFTFGNSTNRIERVGLTIQDLNAHEVKPVEITMSKPVYRNVIQTTISKSKSYVYEMKGKITDSGENVLLELPAISYLLKKGTPYFFYIKHDRSKSNVIQITF